MYVILAGSPLSGTNSAALMLERVRHVRKKNAVKIIRIGLLGAKKSPAARKVKAALRAGRASRGFPDMI